MRKYKKIGWPYEEREVLFFASYCGTDNVECNDKEPCPICLGMSNVFYIKPDIEISYSRQLSEDVFGEKYNKYEKYCNYLSETKDPNSIGFLLEKNMREELQELKNDPNATIEEYIDFSEQVLKKYQYLREQFIFKNGTK